MTGIQIDEYIDVAIEFRPGEIPYPADDDSFDRFADIMGIDTKGVFDRAVAQAGKRWNTVAIRLPDRSGEVV